MLLQILFANLPPEAAFVINQNWVVLDHAVRQRRAWRIGEDNWEAGAFFAREQLGQVYQVDEHRKPVAMKDEF
jgi:hypothetical protein